MILKTPEASPFPSSLLLFIVTIFISVLGGFNTMDIALSAMAIRVSAVH